MIPGRLSLAFLLSFLCVAFALQWWQRAEYPFGLWIALVVIVSVSMIGLLQEETRVPAAWLLVVALGGMLALCSVARTTHRPSAATVDWYARGGMAKIVGKIVEEPDARAAQVRYVVEAFLLTQGGSGTWIPVSGRVLVTDPSGGPFFRYGDILSVRGRLKRPQTIEDFRYDHYLSIAEIYAVLNASMIERKGQAAWSVFGMLYEWKKMFEARLNQLFPEPHAAFAAGLLTGTRRGIPPALADAFMKSGLTHIVAISGYNITIVITVISGFLFWLPLRWRFLPAVVAIIAFTVFVGAGASVVRAAVMGILGLLALTLGRQSTVRLTILWAALAMIAWNPKHLWYDASFQLSFAAVVGLSELSPLVKPILSRFPNILGIRDALEATLTAQLSSVPVALLTFGNLSLAAPLANILVAPAIPVAMLLCSLALMASTVSSVLGRLLAAFGWAILQWAIFVAEFFASIPYASLHFERVSIVLIVSYYLGLAGIVLWRKSAPHKYSQDLSLSESSTHRSPMSVR